MDQHALQRLLDELITTWENEVVAVTGSKTSYIRTRSQDDAFYAKLLTDYLQKFGGPSRAEINELLLSKLSDALGQEQKVRKINNLLTKLHRAGVLLNTGSDRAPNWVLAEKNAEKKK